MSKRSSKPVAEKFEIVLLHLEQGKSISILTRHSGVEHQTIKDWVRKYKGSGIEDLKHTKISSEKISDRREYSLPFLYVKVEVSC